VRLEGLAARLAVAELTAADFKRLRAIVTAMRNAGKRRASDDLTILDFDFHDLINRRSNHRLLLDVLASVSVYTRGFIVHLKHYYLQQTDLQFVANSHALLLEALLSREPDRAEQAVHVHVEHALASLQATDRQPTERQARLDTT
jgi:DNA-binding GntR family transcriptional regulator